MKSNKYWFSKLTKEEQQAFKDELSNDNAINVILEKENLTFYQFIVSYIIWRDSKKGIDFWHETATRKVE